ncbi:MAG: class I SAM-dependent methyltransferase [Anaerolineae bacterium]|nr:class I SAM-dependent methyltransferase [Anaerolineae bacterium]
MVIDDGIRWEMMVYYDERAEEYDQIYWGKGHATIDPDAYKKDVAKASEMVSRFGKGHLIDIACGTGFWLPSYARNCHQITFLDQSERMLSICRDRVKELGLTHAARFIQGDFLDASLGTSEYDCALVGFLLSHLTFQQEKVFFERLEGILKANPQLMLIDSVWNERRQQYREKEGIQERVLSDGRLFRIYKRYFEKPDIEEMLERYDFRMESCYVGDALIAAIAEGCW